MRGKRWPSNTNRIRPVDPPAPPEISQVDSTIDVLKMRQTPKANVCAKSDHSDLLGEAICKVIFAPEFGDMSLHEIIGILEVVKWQLLSALKD